MKKTLLLINPPYPRKVASAPLQLLYLAAALKNTGVDVNLLDLDIKDNPTEVLENRLKETHPTHVGVTSYSPNYPESLDILKNVKEYDGSIITLSGGPHEIALNGKRSSKCIDHVVTDAFGENTLRKLLGIKGQINREELFPAYELLEEHSNYQFGEEFLEGKKIAQLLTATGCSQKCNFCSAQLVYSPFLEDIIISNLQKIIGKGYEAIFFNDPNFTNPFDVKNQGKYGRTISLNRRLVEEGISREIIYGVQTKATMVTPELLDSMYEGGLRYICYALENIDNGSLKELKKGVTPQKVRQAINWSKERGIATGLYVMFGTKKDEAVDLEIVRQTLDYVEEVHPGWLSISVLANYPMKDRTTKKPLHQNLDYANERYSRNDIWLNFDEGWGAHHPYCNDARAQEYLQELDRRKINNPNIWNKIKRF